MSSGSLGVKPNSSRAFALTHSWLRVQITDPDSHLRGIGGQSHALFAFAQVVRQLRAAR